MKKCIISGLVGLIVLTSGCHQFNKGDAKSDGQDSAPGHNSPVPTRNTDIANFNDDRPNDDQNLDDNDLGPSENPTAFEKEFTARFQGFKAVNPRVLEKVVGQVPEQGSTKWSCGLHQSETAIEIAHINHKKARPGTTNFKSPGKYPLAIDANLNHPALAVLGPIKSQFPTDDEGNFRVGALPHDLADYIDDNFPDNYPVQAEAISKNALSSQELFDIVSGNIALGLSTPAFGDPEDGGLLVHVYSIVGFKGDELAILDTNGIGMDRFKIEKTSDFLARLNLAHKIKEIKDKLSLGELFGINFRALISAANGKAAKQETFDKWKAFSLIKFHKAR